MFWSIPPIWFTKSRFWNTSIEASKNILGSLIPLSSWNPKPGPASNKFRTGKGEDDEKEDPESKSQIKIQTQSQKDASYESQTPKNKTNQTPGGPQEARVGESG